MYSASPSRTKFTGKAYGAPSPSFRATTMSSASFRTPSMKSRSARNLSFIPIDSLLVKENSAGKGAALPSSPLRTLGNGGRGWGRGNFPSERFPRPFSMQFTCSPPTRSACGRRNRAARGTVGDFAGDESGPGDVEMRPASVERDELLEEHGGAARPAARAPALAKSAVSLLSSSKIAVQRGRGQ